MGASALEIYLVDKGEVSSSALTRARRSQDETGQSLASVLVNLGLISAEQLSICLSEISKAPRFAKESFPDSPIDLPKLSRDYLRHNKLFPIKITDADVHILMADPMDEAALEAMAFAVLKPIRSFVAPLPDVEEAIRALYFPEELDEDDESASSNSLTHETDDVERLREMASDAPIIRYVNKLVADAAKDGASDIHFEPMEDHFRIRFRLDGVLRDVDNLPRQQEAGITSRIKIMANLNIAERRLAQDGRFKATVDGHEIDLRVSTTPTAYGESVVLRLLDRNQLPGNFTALGFSEDVTPPLIRALNKPDGIILVTGPTGSGKTTTLYSALQMLNSPEKKILTVEDPIEYMLGGVNQVQVDTKIGRTFASTLRSFLRQDPDIMMVGEIRDRETAEIAIQASLTGHLVLSTLHTNSAAGALTRLMDMGVDDFLISSTLTAVVGQRLVRKICPDCCEPTIPNDAVMARIKPHLPKHGQMEFYHGKGCPSCNGTGYKGRMGIIEVLEVTDDIRACLMSKASEGEIERLAIKQGMARMFDYGLKKALRGHTTLEELFRVTRDS